MALGRVINKLTTDCCFQAKDVMIWHVRNEVKIPDISSDAFLKYYTENGFLEQKGGNLRELFRNHAVVRPPLSK